MSRVWVALVGGWRGKRGESTGLMENWGWRHFSPKAEFMPVLK